MKVLFAVNDENISTSIVKKYQKQYKEIISYKNVYYFNAILKELQRNKSYDRVVISEDLEEFTSSSIEQRDKFIFDRLDNISDEAVSTNGADIPIILICSEKRTKREEILVKLFGLGIYNAIIGEDRIPDEVCRLINKPRSKKEAKIYYKIDSENVNYEKENDNAVNEVELQNILTHFKRLGKDEAKYIESFNNVASQYNDGQLKVIISIFPSYVKEILQNSSPEYQRIMNLYVPKEQMNSKESQNRAVSIKKPKMVQKGTSEKLLKVDSNSIMSKPVVVPSTMEKNMYKKVEPKKSIEIDMDELEDEEINNIEMETVAEEKPKRGRGRPRKNPLPQETDVEPKPKRGRGRPRKNPLPEEIEMEEEEISDIEDVNVLPGFEDEISQNTIAENEDYTSTLPGFEDEDLEEDNYNENDYNNFDNDNNSFDNNNSFDLEDETEPDVQNENENEYEDEYEEEYEDEDEYENQSTTYNYENTNNNISQYNNYNNTNNNISQYNNYNNTNNNISKYNNYNNTNNDMRQYENNYDDNKLNSLLVGDKKITAFVGTSKNGTSFIVNNVAQILSNMGINTAILDATYNQNAYYIYTKNDEKLRNIAVNSINNLINGNAEGIKANNNLTVYTTIPNNRNQIDNAYPILETLIKNHSIILIDCDFNTAPEYFDKAQELYLVQSMDVLTIQPLTEFLNELKVKNILSESKIRIILNKLLKIKGVNGKNIIGGMANFNDPEMSFMTELFNKNTVKVAEQIPFDEDVYAKYLESLIECEIKINGYPKEFKNRLNNLAQVIYPLLPNTNKKNKKGVKPVYNQYSSSFSSDMNNTLDNMRKKY